MREECELEESDSSRRAEAQAEGREESPPSEALRQCLQ